MDLFKKHTTLRRNRNREKRQRRAKAAKRIRIVPFKSGSKRKNKRQSMT